MKLYIQAVVILLISLVLYCYLLPKAISAKDSVYVLIGIFSALVWPALVWSFIRKQLFGKKNA